MTQALNPAPLPPGLSPQALIDLHEIAAEWFMRRSEPSWTGADERALDGWLAASPLHREIFEGMALVSHDLNQIPLARDPSWRMPAAQQEVAASPLRRRAAERHLPHASSRPSRIWERRRAWVPAVACVLLLMGSGYGWHMWDTTPGYALDIATARGETRTIDLPDGSTVALNFDSTLQVRYYPRRREVVLDRGEAFFRVAADSGRPFTVDSGASRVRVVGTAFNVRAAPPQIVVKVVEGRVEVRPDRHARKDRVLAMGAGSGVAIDPATGEANRVPAAADTVGDWRTGQIHFQRTPLVEVAQELARYLGQPVVLASDELAGQPVSGVAATTRPQAFLQALPEVLPLRVQQLTDGSWRIAKR